MLLQIISHPNRKYQVNPLLPQFPIAYILNILQQVINTIFSNVTMPQEPYRVEFNPREDFFRQILACFELCELREYEILIEMPELEILLGIG